MAKYLVLETSFIGLSLVNEGTVVDINDDPSTGGMTPGANLTPCDDEGNPVAAPKAPAAKKAKAKAEAEAPATDADLA